MGEAKIEDLQNKCLDIQRSLKYNLGLDEYLTEESHDVKLNKSLSNGIFYIVYFSLILYLDSVHRLKKVFMNKPSIFWNFRSLIIFLVILTIIMIIYLTQNELRLYKFKISIWNFLDIYFQFRKLFHYIILELTILRYIYIYIYLYIYIYMNLGRFSIKEILNII